MKRKANHWTGAIAVTAMMTTLLTGCGDTLSDAAVSTISFQKDGSVETVTVEDFAEDYYSEDELAQTISEELTKYNTGQEAVKNKELKVKDGTARLTMEYAEGTDYASFNDCVFYYGSVSGAVAAGYDLSSVMNAVSREDTNKVLVTKDLDTLAENKMIILTEPTEIRTYAKILYAGANVTVTGDKEASVQEASEQEPAILILTD